MKWVSRSINGFPSSLDSAEQISITRQLNPKPANRAVGASSGSADYRTGGNPFLKRSFKEKRSEASSGCRSYGRGFTGPVPPKYARRVVTAYRCGALSKERTVELLWGTVTEADLPDQDEVPMESLRGGVEFLIGHGDTGHNDADEGLLPGD